GHARETGLNLIAVMKAELGDLDRVKRIVKMLGMVNAVPEFGHQPEVINGCSDLFVEVFGDRGRHARSAVGMGSLPRGIPVGLEVIVGAEEPPAGGAGRRRAARKRVRRRSVERIALPGGAAGGGAGGAGASPVAWSIRSTIGTSISRARVRSCTATTAAIPAGHGLRQPPSA